MRFHFYGVNIYNISNWIREPLLSAGEPSWSIVVHSAADVERFFKETVENRFIFSYLSLIFMNRSKLLDSAFLA